MQHPGFKQHCFSWMIYVSPQEMLAMMLVWHSTLAGQTNLSGSASTDAFWGFVVLRASTITCFLQETNGCFQI